MRNLRRGVSFPPFSLFALLLSFLPSSHFPNFPCPPPFFTMFFCRSSWVAIFGLFCNGAYFPPSHPFSRTMQTTFFSPEYVFFCSLAISSVSPSRWIFPLYVFHFSPEIANFLLFPIVRIPLLNSCSWYRQRFTFNPLSVPDVQFTCLIFFFFLMFRPERAVPPFERSLVFLFGDNLFFLSAMNSPWCLPPIFFRVAHSPPSPSCPGNPFFLCFPLTLLTILFFLPFPVSIFFFLIRQIASTLYPFPPPPPPSKSRDYFFFFFWVAFWSPSPPLFPCPDFVRTYSFRFPLKTESVALVWGLFLQWSYPNWHQF